MSQYRVAPLFLIRMAGVSFEPLSRLATPQSSAIAKELITLEKRQAQAAAEAESFFSSRQRLLAPEAYNALRAAVRSLSMPVGDLGEQPPIFANYKEAANVVFSANERLRTVLGEEVQAVRRSLIESTRSYIADYLLFGAESVRGLLAKQLEEYPCHLHNLTPRHNVSRKIEQSLLLYLQRVAAKNDTFSRFGPSAWGRATGGAGICFSSLARTDGREIFLERWTAHAIAAAMNADVDVFNELSPRLNPLGRLTHKGFYLVETGETIALNESELEVVRRIDGQTPAYQIDSKLLYLPSLVERNVMRCRIEVPAMEPHAFEVLLNDVVAWRSGPTRDKWHEILREMVSCLGSFAGAEGSHERQGIMERAVARLRSVAGIPTSKRFLYSASNVIGEECVRGLGLEVFDKLLDEVPRNAARWIDFWRDSYAFVASRVAAGLRDIFDKAKGSREAVPLPAFLRACETAKLSLTGPGLVVLSAVAFREVKNAFLERLLPYANEQEYGLTLEDCQIVRDTFDYPGFDEYTYPSADLQLSARSFAAVDRGEYCWIIGELHPPPALLHHGFYWGCPDKPELSRALASTIGNRPNFHFGFGAADFTSHTTVRIFDALPQLTYFVAPERGNPEWKTVPPAEAEVFVDENNGDVGLRERGSHQYLGSFARAWLIPLGFHPFHFGRAPHMPRLRCGNVIVQRESWTVTLDELAAGDFTGISTHLVVAIEKLRAEKKWPRHVYIRPTEQALRRSGAEGRDKDTKPVFIDLESYLFMEIFYRWLKKAGELEVTEMLPDPDHLCWQEADGRRTFELRTLIVPRT